MALEALLPSEVARLVYGYLIDEKCLEAAKVFLHESPHLAECRSVLSLGRHFTTRVCGHVLIDILEKFCLINTLVQEKIENVENLNKLKQYSDVVEQIRFLLEEYKGLQLLNDKSITSQSSPTTSSEPSSNNCNGQEVRNLNVLKQTQLNCDKQTNFTTDNAYLSNPLECRNNLDFQKYNVHKSSRKPKEKLKINHVPQEQVLKDSINVQEAQNKNENVLDRRYNNVHKNSSLNTRSKELKNSEVQTSYVQQHIVNKDVAIDTNEDNLRYSTNVEVQTSNVGSPSTEELDENDPLVLLNNVTLELLNRTEMHEKIAENINKVLDPQKFNLHDVNKAFKEARDMTTNDPDFLDLLASALPPVEDVMSTEDEVDMELELNQNIYEVKALHSSENTDANNIITTTTKSPSENDFPKEQKQFQTQLEQVSAIPESTNNFKAIEMEHDGLLEKLNCNKNDAEPSQISSVEKKSEAAINNKQNNVDSNAKEILDLVQTSNNEQNSIAKFSHNNTVTSTPIKTCTAISNFDECDWFATEDLPSPNLAFHKDDAIGSLKTNNLYVLTASESIVTATTSFLSPIAFKDTCIIREKAVVSCSVTNTVKDTTLHTPDLSYQPKSLIPATSMSCVPVTSNTLKNKSPTPQKSSEIIEDILNMQVLQGSNGNIESLSPLLKDISLCNKYFNGDSMVLHGADNAVASLPATINVPQIEVEDSLSLTGTGLSPFIKVQKTEPLESARTEQPGSNAVDRPNRLSVIPGESSDEASKVTSASVADVILGKSTPKTLLDIRSRNSRLGLSAPKKPGSHVRALTFDTPPKQSHSDSKRIDQPLSPETLRRSLKSACKSSLFQSPPFSGNDDPLDAQPQTLNNAADNVIVISDEESKSNVNSKSSKKQSAAGVNNVIVLSSEEDKSDADTKKGKSLVTNNNTLKERIVINKDGQTDIEKSNAAKTSWDSDLRKYIAMSNVEKKEEPKKRPIKKREGATKKPEGSSSKKLKKDNKSTPKKLEKKDKSTPHKSKKSHQPTPKKTKKKDKSTPAKLKKNNRSKNDERKENIEKNCEEMGEEELEELGAQIEAQITFNPDEKEIGNKEQIKKSNVKPDSKPRIKKIVKLDLKDSYKINKDIVMPPQKCENAKSASVKTEVLKNKDIEKSNVKPEPPQSKSITPQVKESADLKKKDEVHERNPVEILLSDSIENNEEDDVMKLASEEVKYFGNISDESILRDCNDTKDDSMIEKMQADEKSMTALFTESNKNTSITEINSKSSSYETLDSGNSSIDAKKLEEQLSQFANEQPVKAATPKAEVIYDEVSKMEQGRVVRKKYARLTTLDNSIADPSDESRQILSSNFIIKDLDKSPSVLISDDTTTTTNPPPTESKTCVTKPAKATKVAEVLKKSPPPRVLSPDHGTSSLAPVSAAEEETSASLPKPITPRVLSPGSGVSLMVPISKTFNEDSHTITSLITPLECPPTPKITLTPFKDDEKENAPQAKKPEGDYYQSALPPFKDTTAKSDVTEFEVVKEVLLKTEKQKPQPDAEVEKAESSDAESSDDETSKNDTLGSDSSSESSSSSSDSSMSSSSSSSSSDDDASDKEDESEEKEVTVIEKIPETPAVPEYVEEEASPVKVMPIHKTDKQLAETMKETPAKDENAEVEIHDTPNISKPIEAPTNLHAKISQMLIQKEREEAEILQSKAKTESTESTLREMSMKPKKSLIETLPEEIQRKAYEVKEETKKAARTAPKLIEKSENEVAKAIESITALKPAKSASLESVNKSDIEDHLSSVDPLNNSSKKRELSKAIASIKTFSDSDDSRDGKRSDSSESENLELVLEDDEGDRTPRSREVRSDNDAASLEHSHNTRWKSRQKQQIVEEDDELDYLGNSETRVLEIHEVFDEGDQKTKKRRRRCVKEEDLQMTVCMEDETFTLRPSNFEMLFEEAPKRRKRQANEIHAQDADGNDFGKKRKKDPVRVVVAKRQRKNVFVY